MLTGALQEGVIEAGAYMVTERSAGANMSVDIAANDGSALVQGDSITAQGLYHIPPHSASINETIAAADSTHPRVDQVILEVRDNTHDASGGNEARVRVVAGTATSGATLDNRTGAAALPSNAIRLADVLVPALDTSIGNSQIRDRRPWARGAFTVIERSSGNYTTTSTGSLAAIDSTNLNPRVECSGVPLRVSLMSQASHSVVNARTRFDFAVDGTLQAFFRDPGGVAATYNQVVAHAAVFTPSTGSHRVAPYWAATEAGTATLAASATSKLVFVVEEVVRQDSANNTTTSG